MQTAPLIYFSSRSENCHRFVQKLNLQATRIIEDEILLATQPFVLLCPTMVAVELKVQFLRRLFSF